MLDYSSLLSFQDDQVNFTYENNKLMILEIENFQIQITADKTLLTPLYRHFINPLEIEIIGAKDIPVANDKNYE